MNRSFRDQLNGLIRLTRWKEHLPFVIPLTALGALLATTHHGLSLDWRLIPVMLANVLVVAYAFMINDIEDAPDDARDPDRAKRNPITMGEIDARLGYWVCAAVAVVSLLLFALGGQWALLIGAITLALSHLYSWRLIRLKAWPVTDVVSHSLMLSGLLLLAGYFTYDANPGLVWFVAAGVTLVSVYGQLYNQIRDYDMDRAAGLHNSAILLGERNARIAMYGAVAVALLCILVAVLNGVFPLWLMAVLLISLPISRVARTQGDMRGTEVIDPSGRAQLQGLFVVNAVVGAWLVWVMFSQWWW